MAGVMPTRRESAAAMSHNQLPKTWVKLGLGGAQRGVDGAHIEPRITVPHEDRAHSLVATGQLQQILDGVAFQIRQGVG